MRAWRGGFALLVLAFGLATSAAADADAASLTVTVRNARNAAGIITVSVFNSEATFLDNDLEFASIDVPARPGDIPVVFEGLPPGTYAVAAFHDENVSGSVDTNFLGIPTEGYGFSNGARVFLGPPSFKDAAVELPPKAKVETKLELSY
ncbi:MAG: DUF2141 domain-containing protein [Alphaproteobacteria bacterium]